MLKIRLQRTGRINDPSFRVIVVEHARSTKTGTIVERVGSYNPRSKDRVLNAERILYWISKGAQASGTMHNMLISAGVIKGKKRNVLPKKTVPKKGDSAQTAAPHAVGAAAVPAAEASVEEPETEAAKAKETASA